MKVTIAICTYNRSDLLRQTLERMTELEAPVGADWSILVADNNSTDDTATTIAAFAGRLPIRSVFVQSPGQSHAQNRILAETADADYILWTDDDVQVDLGWLSSFVEAARMFPEGVVFGGPCRPWFPQEPNHELAQVFPGLAAGFCTSGFPGPEGIIADFRPEHIIGMNMGMKRSACHGLLFDPRLSYSPSSYRAGQETDFIQRLLARGGDAIWVDGMAIAHYVMPSRMTLDYLTKFTGGLGQVHVHDNGVPPGTKMFGVPRWLLLKVCVEYGRFWLARARGLRIESLEHLRLYWFCRGMIRECHALKDNVPSVSALSGSEG